MEEGAQGGGYHLEEVPKSWRCIDPPGIRAISSDAHIETLALKALTLHSTLPLPMTVGSKPKHEEAETMARTAVKKDITSHITWHVLGIFAKSRKDWEEATRAFAMARKQDNV